VVDLVFREAVRLHPPVPVIPRRTEEGCTIAGFHIPAGTNIALNIGYTQIMEEWWQRPLSFEPDRFSAPRNEHQQHKFLWLPFGAGPHKCLGSNFAQIEIKVFLYYFLRQFTVGLCPGRRYRIQTFPIPKPSENLRLVLTRAALAVRPEA
jgi:cytochrome P450